MRGFRIAYDLVDPVTGDSLSFGIFDDENSVRAAERRVGEAPAARDRLVPARPRRGLAGRRSRRADRKARLTQIR
jgi:hypothetical protein